ncbi:MAG: hypothetical protein AAF466_06425 [Bacteroidota bacterium]
MKTILIAIAFLITVPSQVFATNCPPPPTPLRQLIEQAEFIVTGTVNSIEDVELSYYVGKKVDLQISQVLQGQVVETSISFFLEAYLPFDSHEDITVGAALMAFMVYSEEDNIYTPAGYHTSFKLLDNEGMTVHKERIKELQVINMFKDEKRREVLTTNWLIDCAENPHTRFDGVSELYPYSNYMRYYDAELEEYVQRITFTDIQKNRIRNIILATEEYQFFDLMLVDTIGAWNDKEVYDQVVAFIRTLDSDHLWSYSSFFYRIAYGTQREELTELLEKIQNLDYDDTFEDRANEIAAEFVKML